MSVTPLMTLDLPRGAPRLALGVRAGDWIFGTGLLAMDGSAGISQQILGGGRPYSGLPAAQKEAEAIFAKVKEILAEGGSLPSRVVRLDQYYSSWKAVPHYHVARHKAFLGARSIPASTSILMPGLLLPDAQIEVEMIALAEDAGIRIEPMTPDGLDVPSVMGFAPVVRAGDFVFLAGQMAEEEGHAGIAAAARVPETHLWKGHAVALETRFILERKFKPALTAARSSLEQAVKAQAYLSDMREAPAFLRTWLEMFGSDGPALTVIPTARLGFNCREASLEINLVALTEEAAPRRKVLRPKGVSTPFDGVPPGVLAGDLLFCSGLVAADENGPLPGIVRDPSRPWFGSPAEIQMEYILDMVQRLCDEAGTSLENVVRIQLYHTDLSEFHDCCRVWKRRLGDRPLPLSVMLVPAPLPIPGTTILADMWIHVPQLSISAGSPR
ncbi:RidA family protein [Telmatospirillum sp. J64-1]|uniref:RidA family protein n=1 Tax=Telmatospirillum sp. J64-1 TaxID=2502183 RepID=UPI00115F3F8B|nr:Rid family hydrolase [Telmatospirillum sp. J64-1]